MSLIALALLSSPAHALSCLWGVHSSSVADGEQVPANAQIVLAHTYDDTTELDFVLEDADGEPVDFERVEQRHSIALVPTASLAEGSYTVRVLDLQEFSFDTQFTVGPEEDLEAPASPDFISAEKHNSATDFGDSKGIAAEVSSVDGAVLYEFEIATEADYSDAERVTAMGPNAFVGKGLCDASAPGYEPKADYRIRVRAIDVAGNASDWTEFAGPIRSAGCSSTQAPASLLLGGLAALALFRRPREQ